MKKLILPLLCASLSYGAIDTINSFQANFIQKVTDDKNTTIEYKGSVQAKRPQEALWNYIEPIKKDVYITPFNIIVVEPEIEQVIVRRIHSNFNFFRMIKNAQLIKENIYKAYYKKAEFIITTKENLIESISYKDEFENNVVISFENQKQNIAIDETVFIAKYPEDFDLIED